MAAKKTTTNTNTSSVATEEVVAEETVVKEEETTTTTKKFDKEDLIPCRSITNGGLYVDGDKTGMAYRWADYGDIIDIEYQDLIYMVRARKSCVMIPRFVVMDDDFIEQNPTLSDLYDSMYSKNDLKGILDLNANDMAAAIEGLPKGAKDAVKGLAATMIDLGALDSIKKVKALDEIFGTKLLLTLAEE